MKTPFLTGYFEPFLPFFDYFTANNLTLKPFLTFAAIFLLAAGAPAQNFNNIEFIENRGQWDNRVQYKGAISNGAFYIRSGGFTVVQHHPGDFAAMARFLHGHTADGNPVKSTDKITLRSHAWNVDFVGASSFVKTVPDKMIPTYNNYFIGNDPSKWSSGCRIYQAITFKDVYPNIDVRYYTDNEYLKYDIIVKPGGDPSRIALKYEGAGKLSVKNKELVIATSVGDLKESAPYTYQSSPNGKMEVQCKYVVKDDIVRFELKNYDPAQTLVIDPVIVFGSFSGSAADNWGFTATYGPDGSMFGGGIVLDAGGFPVSPGAFQTSYNGGTGNTPSDMGIIKLTPNGNNRVYATYIGGGSNDQPHSLVVDGQGNLVIAGRSNSSNYPVVNPGGQVGPGGGYDIVVTKLNATGTALIGSRKIGGSQNDGVNISDVRDLNSLQRNYGDDGRSEVILDAAANVYVASSTQSNNFPVTPGAFQTTYGGGNQDGVLLKLTPTLNAVSFASYLGGTANDAAYVLSLRPGSNEIYVAGGTESGNLPGSTAGTVNPANLGGIDGFVSVISNNGNTILRTTYIGTSAIDQVFGVQFDQSGFPYVMGQTTGNWPIINATYNNPAGKQFIAKLQPDLSAYIYSTAFGSGASTPNISPIAFLVDRCENVYISGWGGFFFGNNTFGSAGTTGLPVTADAFKSNTDGKDLYFFVLKKNATQQLFGSFYGETNPPNAGCDHVDGGTSRFDAEGVIYQAICGNCKLNLPPINPIPSLVTAGSWSSTNNSPNCNLTMIKIAMNLAGVEGGIRSEIGGVRDTAGCVPLTVSFIDSIGTAQSYEWYFNYVPGNAPSQTTTVPTASHTFNTVGSFPVMLVAIDPNTCNVRDSSFLTIRVGNQEALLNFSYLKLPPCQAFTYQFTNTTQTPLGPAALPNSYIWDFGDGSPLVQQNGFAPPIVHSFPGAGTYNVKLKVVDTRYCNAPDSLIVPLSIDANVRAAFTTPATGCLPYSATFRNTSIAGQTWVWDFGDGNSSTQFEPTHTYTTAGTYNVRLIASNPNTCNLADTTAIFTIRVFDSPTPDFNFSPVPPEVNTPVTFTNLSSPDAIRFRWDFGDGDTLLTTSRAPVQHQFNSTGTFNVCLTAYNNIGCDSTICKPVVASIIPLVDVPNAFTPNSGDVNSVLMVKGFGIAKMQFIIWNRWGQKVFETTDQLIGWDGRVKGALQPMDVYVYTLNIEFSDGTKTTKKGDITLIR